jgi:hypothetical protein
MTVRDVCFRSLAGTADIVRIIPSSSQTRSKRPKVNSSGSTRRLARKGYANFLPICGFQPTRRTNRWATSINKIETKLADIDRLKCAVFIHPL